MQARAGPPAGVSGAESAQSSSLSIRVGARSLAGAAGDCRSDIQVQAAIYIFSLEDAAADALYGTTVASATAAVLCTEPQPSESVSARKGGHGPRPLGLAGLGTGE